MAQIDIDAIRARLAEVSVELNEKHGAVLLAARLEVIVAGKKQNVSVTVDRPAMPEAPEPPHVDTTHRAVGVVVDEMPPEYHADDRAATE